LRGSKTHINIFLTSLQDQRGLGGGGLGCDNFGRGGMPNPAGGGIKMVKKVARRVAKRVAKRAKEGVESGKRQ